jgi:thymidylate synthase ThyX
MLTLEWQDLTPRHGFDMPPEIAEAGADADWNQIMQDSAALWDDLRSAGLGPAAQYAVAMAYRIRFVMHMNAREAMHLIELRSTPQGHPAYRRVAQEMHGLIAGQAGHRAIAGAMSHTDHSSVELERLEAERRSEARRQALEGA